MRIVSLSAYGYEAEICPSRGANLIRLSRPAWGIEALRTPNSETDFQTQNCYLWGIPILFPPNRIANGHFSFEGRDYRWPVNEPATGHFLHGSIHETPFAVLKQTSRQAVFCYQATREKPYLTFPHAFTMFVVYSLAEDGLHQRITIRNDSELNMPVALGFHTTFRIPFIESGRAADVRLLLSVGREIIRNMDDYLPTGEILTEYALKNEFLTGQVRPCEHTISRHFEMAEPRQMILLDTESGARILYAPGEAYHYWMLYNGGSPDFLCVEPQTWINNCPNAPFDRTQTGFAWLTPGEQRDYTAMIRLDKM